MAETLGVVVLISGRGSNLSALLDHQQDGGYQVTCVISNRPDAAGLQRAREAGVETGVVDHRQFDQRAKFDAALASAIEKHAPGLVVLAGFMRVLGAGFVDRFAGRLINIHPSLLPRFKGLNTHERALKAAVKRHGASVHYVTDELDGGPVIAQITLDVRADDTPETLAQRLLPREHRLLTSVVEWIANGSIRYDKGRVWHEGRPLDAPLRVGAGADS